MNRFICLGSKFGESYIKHTNRERKWKDELSGNIF